MKINFIVLFFIHLCFFTYGQSKVLVLNSLTNEVVPYTNIWVGGENVGTTSDENGVFMLPKLDSVKTLVFSSIGYKTLEIPSDSLMEKIFLHPSPITLQEVVVRTSKQTEEMVIGEFKKGNIKGYFSCGKIPWVSARFFPYKSIYEATPFLKKITVLTDSNLKKSKFKIRLYSKNEQGQPQDYIYHKDIFGIARKGKKRTEVDVSQLGIRFPKDGFFIAVEWLVIEENKYKFNYTMEGARKKLQGVSYEPAIGTILSNTDENSWIFLGDWIKPSKSNFASKRFQDHYDLIAIELTLSN